MQRHVAGARRSNTALGRPCRVQVAAGLGHCLGLLADGSVASWGWNSAGALPCHSLPAAPSHGALLRMGCPAAVCRPDRPFTALPAACVWRARPQASAGWASL